MQQSRNERLKLAQEAARQSSLISGVEIDPSSESFKIHVDLMRSVMGCEKGVLVHPVIFNSPLCGHPHEARYRTGLRAAVRGVIPEASKVKSILQEWWSVQQTMVREARDFPEDFRVNIAWQSHDFLISLEPFQEANARTARLMYYSYLVALNLPIKLITVEKAAEYAAHQREYRQKIFTPLMISKGQLD